MSYNAWQQQRADSPLTGRGLGVRHRGGGTMGGSKGAKGATTTGGLAGNPATGGLVAGSYTPPPGSLAADAAMAPQMQSGGKK